MTSLVDEVNMHHGNFQEVALILQSHKQHVVGSGAVSEKMTQFINELIKDNENKSVERHSVEGIPSLDSSAAAGH